MKTVLFILAISFLIRNCPAEYVFSGPIKSFLATIGLGNNTPQYEKIQSYPEPQHDPLFILLVSFDGVTTMGTVGNPLLFGQYIRNDEFIDLLIACPKKGEEPIKKAKKTDKDSKTETRTLFIEKSYASLVTEYMKRSELLSKENSQKDGTDAQNNENVVNEEEQKPKQDEISSNDKIKDSEDVPESKPMELDLDSVKNPAIIGDHKDGETNIPTSNQEDLSKLEVAEHEKIEDHGDTPKTTAMELDSDKEKYVTHSSIQENDAANILDHHLDAEANSKNSIHEGNEEINQSVRNKNETKNSLDHDVTTGNAAPKENKVNASDENGENQKEQASDQNKIEMDQASIQITNGANPNKPETNSTSTQKTDGSDSTQTETVSVPESKTQTSRVQKISNALDDMTPKTKKYWLRALDDANDFKCEKPVAVHLLPYPSKSKYKFYMTGFEIFLENFENLDIPEFTKLPNRKYKWFWSFTIVLTEADRNVVCVYHEVQYNKDTYNSEINENFEDHDLGKEMMFPELDISQLYEIKNQEEVFQKLFKNEADQKKYFDVDKKNFLVRVHLAPLHGFVTPAVRQSAKTYGNVAPMWNSIRNGAWRKLEDYVNILSHAFIDLIVITGTYGNLNLDGNDVYLADGKKVPVPLAFWKMVIYGTELDNCRGMLIITSNNPYEDIGNVICGEDKCHEYGWGYIQENDISRGKTICCEFTPEILEHLPILAGVQPPRILNLNILASTIVDLWEFNELGERTSLKDLHDILDKLKLDEKMIRSLENEDVSTNIAKDPQNPEELATLLWANKQVVM